MLRQRLAAREREGHPIRVGVVGAGRFGTMIVCQLAAMPGMRPSVVADLDLARARAALAHGGVAGDRVIHADRAGHANPVIARGDSVVTADAAVVVDSDVDVVVDATGSPEAAAATALAAIRRERHVVMVTVEADVLAGAVFRRAADGAGVVYSAAYGDQPALIYELYDWAAALGFDVVAAGKGTKYLPAYRKGVPDDVWERYGMSETAATGLNPKMYNSFTDGTKSAIEMAAVANMTGLHPDVRGMHFPPVGTDRLPEVLKPASDGGILRGSGVVEVVSSIDRDGRPVPYDLRWGVYVVFTSPRPYVRAAFREYGLSVDRTGRYASFYRPYHLVGLELPISAARAVLDGVPTGTPRTVPCAAVASAAKRALRPGDMLDGEGGSTVYGLADDALAAARERLLPIGLSHGARVVRAVPEDGLVRLDDVELDTSSALYRLWEDQQRLLEGGGEEMERPRREANPRRQ
ncbi:MAG TPA: flagellar biosynthesis protein FlgA [bacterium]|nr:flagellar biosynthesis protein FlgA [bacterium]